MPCALGVMAVEQTSPPKAGASRPAGARSGGWPVAHRRRVVGRAPPSHTWRGPRRVRGPRAAERRGAPRALAPGIPPRANRNSGRGHRGHPDHTARGRSGQSARRRPVIAGERGRENSGPPGVLTAADFDYDATLLRDDPYTTVRPSHPAPQGQARAGSRTPRGERDLVVPASRTGEPMTSVTARDGGADDYEAVVLPGSAGPPVFLRRSARPTRRAVLHLHDLSGSLGPPDLARWYTERGFHFFVTDIDRGEAAAAASRRRPQQALRRSLLMLDAVSRHLREASGIDALILSAQESAALAAACWCHLRRAGQPAQAMILSGPDFGRARRLRLDITCPVLVVGAHPGPQRAHLGAHVTWLDLEDQAAGQASDGRRRLFDEMGRWLGAYMYGQVRDRLL